MTYYIEYDRGQRHIREEAADMQILCDKYHEVCGMILPSARNIHLGWF